LKAIGMGDFSSFATKESLGMQWASLAFEGKRMILDRARMENEKFAASDLPHEASKLKMQAAARLARHPSTSTR
jgi:hypothetical protein